MKTLIITTLTLSLGVFCNAAPYFRLIDPAHPQISAGALYSLTGFNELQAVTDVALITHSSQDGSLIPESLQHWIAPESWTPLQLGGGYGSGNAVMNFGASTNVLPELSLLSVNGIDALGDPDFLSGLRNVLSDKTGSLSLAAGWTPSVNVVRGGTILPFNQLRVLGRIYSGACWKF